MERLIVEAQNSRRTASAEFHRPRCPKYTTQGEKACRGGARPLEAALEDALNE